MKVCYGGVGGGGGGGGGGGLLYSLIRTYVEKSRLLSIRDRERSVAY